MNGRYAFPPGAALAHAFMTFCCCFIAGAMRNAREARMIFEAHEYADRMAQARREMAARDLADGRRRSTIPPSTGDIRPNRSQVSMVAPCTGRVAVVSAARARSTA